MHEATFQIERHKTAIRRPGLSLPISCLIRDGLLATEQCLFDYGCGRGQDLVLLSGMGVSCDGWDPVHRSSTNRKAAEVVNLGYVINVIEDPRERATALRGAWELARSLLVVSAQLTLAAPSGAQACYSDGVITSRRTFQKYYSQAELRTYLEEQLGTDAIAAAPGVFYVFKNEAAKHQFLASRFRRRATVPPQRVSELLFEQNRDLLVPFMEQLTLRGRVPGPEEFARLPELTQRFGSVKRAFGIIQRVTASDEWATIAQKHSEDLLVYLALSRFHRRPVFSKLPLDTQLDVKAFFGSYDRACKEADALLFAAGDPAKVDSACRAARVGRLVENALLVHRGALDSLNPLLRMYEGCARALVGEIDEANVVKLHRFSGKVTYLTYPEFETDPHPVLKSRLKVALRTLWMDHFDYSSSPDPPILSRKADLLQPDHPLAERFSKLTLQERKHGIVGEADGPETREELLKRLAEAGRVLRGHRLYRLPNASCHAVKSGGLVVGHTAEER